MGNSDAGLSLPVVAPPPEDPAHNSTEAEQEESVGSGTKLTFGCPRGTSRAI